jgi:hypothetical protein
MNEFGAHDFRAIDKQLAEWHARLTGELGVSAAAAPRLASAIAEEVSALDPQLRLRIREAQHVTLGDRLDELSAFQAFMDSLASQPIPPFIVRAQVIVQNYVCFVYLGESCFQQLRKALPSSSATRRCCKFLTENPVRAFRNALAHSNWRYRSDFSGLEFWARAGASIDEPLRRWDVSHQDLTFWQALARCTAYAAYLSL